MPGSGDLVTRYNGLMEQNGFTLSNWAEKFQQLMRERRLTDSGRLLSPVLRPCFVTQQQVAALAEVASQLELIFDEMEALIMARPALLSRLQLLPAEKSLLAIDPGYKHFSIAASFDALFHDSNLCISAVDTCRPTGLAYASALADVFLQLPIVKELGRSGLKVSKMPGLRRVTHAVQAAWQQFGGKGKPAVAVVDWAHANLEGASEGELLATTLSIQGMDAKFVPPEKLSFQGGELTAAGRRIDLVVRRVLVRELLTRWDLNHPLLEAYRARAVCMVNSLRAELGQRRSFLELLTDDSVTAHLPQSHRQLLKQVIPWTRFLSARKVDRHGVEIDLPAWVSKNREHLALLPDQPLPELRCYPGKEMNRPAWDYAVKQALRTPYVVQECGVHSAESFPFFQYGEFKLRDVNVTLQTQVISGELGDCLAVLRSTSPTGISSLGIAPVLLVQ